jgi:hypothetical protein
VNVREVKTVGTVLALISTDPDEALDAAATRALRATSVSILGQPDWLIDPVG